jgi:3-methyladenine DNA glycosylase AlkD
VGQVDDILNALKKRASKKIRDDMAPRYGIVTPNAFGVRMADMRAIAKKIGRDHKLAASLWDTGWYEARTVAAFVEEPELVTPAQMDRWARDFDNWAICDTVCFHLFDRTPHAFARVKKWSGAREEFVKRAAFALLASLALHDKKAEAESFSDCLSLIEKAATDNRNFVKKGVSWALRSIGRRKQELAPAAATTARRLAESDNAAARWVGNDALREFKKVAARTGIRAQAKRVK